MLNMLKEKNVKIYSNMLNIFYLIRGIIKNELISLWTFFFFINILDFINLLLIKRNIII